MAIGGWSVYADKNGSNIVPVLLEVVDTLINIIARNTSDSLDATNVCYTVYVVYSKD